jgi:protein-tyrosine kinase
MSNGKRSAVLVPGQESNPLVRFNAAQREGRLLLRSIRRNLNDPESVLTLKHLRDLIFFHSKEKTKAGKTIGFAGPSGKEGTTSLSILLGLSLGELRRNRVIFIDGRLERQSFSLYSEMFGLTKNSLNYSNGAGSLQCYSTKNQNMCFLMPGPDMEPLEFFSNDEVVPLFVELREAFDYVIFDMPPVLNSSETRLLLPHLDLFFLVCASRKTTFSEVERCKRITAGTGSAIKGVVVNKQKLPFWAPFLGREAFF